MEIPKATAAPGEPTYFDDDVIGLLANGVVLDSHKATWTYDSCVGHSDIKHQYHYHIPPLCLLAEMGLSGPDSPEWWINDTGDEVRTYAEMAEQFPASGSPSPVIGFARDGYPIFGPYDESGSLVVAADGDLDECNGKEDGNGNYAYFLSVDPPFAPPCLRGEVGLFTYFTSDLMCPTFAELVDEPETSSSSVAPLWLSAAVAATGAVTML